jgi:predicted nucleotidyltransferase
MVASRQHRFPEFSAYFAKLYTYLSSLARDENEEDTDIEMFPNIHDDEKVEIRQCERIIELYPSLSVIEGQWIDLENIISLPLEFTILIDSLKKRLRRQLDTPKKTVGFKIVSDLNGHVSRQSYYVYKYSLFTLLCTWNVLSFKSSMALESKRRMMSNQNIERMLEEVRECLPAYLLARK